jgi:hypothetical protein
VEDEVMLNIVCFEGVRLKLRRRSQGSLILGGAALQRCD